MIHIGIDIDLCWDSLERAVSILWNTTQLPPAGIIVGEGDALCILELLQLARQDNYDFGFIMVTILKYFPYNGWIVYNHMDGVYSNGA